jgi:cold shock CspA family protein
MNGKIRQLNERGFGFIQPAGDTDRAAGHFFHAKHLVGATFDALKVGFEVEFDSAYTDKGLQAENVKLVS